MAKRKEKKTKAAVSTRWGSTVRARVPEPSSRAPFNAQVVEIPNEYDVVPAVEWVNGRPRMFRVAIRKSLDSGDIPVTKRRASKTA